MQELKCFGLEILSSDLVQWDILSSNISSQADFIAKIVNCFANAISCSVFTIDTILVTNYQKTEGKRCFTLLTFAAN